MKIKKYMLIIFILLTLVNITCIAAMDNNTFTTNISQNISNINTDEQINILTQKTENINEIHQTTENDQLSFSMHPPDDNYYNNKKGEIYHTQLILTIENFTTFSTANTTMNVHLDWDLYMSKDYYDTCQIRIYENNTKIHAFNVSDQNNAEYEHNAHQTLDVTFPYTIKDRTELKAVILQIESNTLSFEEIKKINLTNLNNNNIIVNNTYFSNENWTNQIKYLKKAINDAPTNSIIYLNNMEILNDEDITITIDKNITIIANNTIINGLDHGTIFTINSQATLTLINLTFTNISTNYIMQNNGNLKIVNNNFNNNIGRLISNNGNLTIEDSIIENTTKYYALFLNNIKTTSENGLIYNKKTLNIKNTTFNNINLNPLTNNNKKLDWNAIIVNYGKTIVTDSKFTNINYRTIYNNAILEIKNTIMENITSTDIFSHTIQYTRQLNNTGKYFSYIRATSSLEGGAIYNIKHSTITNTTFQKITGKSGAIYNKKTLNITNTTFQSINNGAIYNNEDLTISNSTFQTISGEAIYTKNANITNSRFQTISGKALYNIGTLNINNILINKSTGIHNDGILTINNTIINKCGGIYNNNQLNVNNTLFNRCSGVGAAVYNNNIANIENCEIIENHGDADTKWRYVEQPNGQVFSYIVEVYSGVIYNYKNAKINITKSIIKNNDITEESNGNWDTYYGIIKNDGEMKITGCILDGNKPREWSTFWGGDGSINIYNTGKLTYKYNYLLNTQYYTGNIHKPSSFLFNTGNGACDVNYNFYCLKPSSIFANANYNYYFVPYFGEYIPIKLNETRNITLSLGLTNGADYMTFNDWDKLLTPGLNATITTIDENGKYKNITTLLKDKYTFNFNYTHVKGEYIIYSNILNFKSSALVDVGKEFAEMEVNYNNITYKEGNITFHIKIKGNLTTQPTGNITLRYKNKKIILNLTDSECSFTIPEILKPDNYTMRIDYDGDDEYFKILNQYFIFAVYKIPTNITVVAPEVKYGQTGLITITITPGEAKLKGKLYINGIYTKNADTQGHRILRINRNPGVYNISVVFESDEYYMGGVANTTFIVSKWKTNLTLTCKDIDAGEDAIVNITIDPGDVRGDAILIINDVNQTIFINNTVTPITISNLQNGTYHVSVYYPGDKKYAPSNASTTFTVSMKTTKLTVNITSNDDLTGNIRVNTDYNDCTGKVGVYINNDNVLIMNLTNGSCNFPVKFKRGNNYIYIHYIGDKYYSYASWNTTRFIEGKAIINTNYNHTIDEQELGYYIIKIFDSDNNPYEYTNFTALFQNKEILLTTDDNGVAKLPIQCRAGTYNITVKYKNTVKKSTVVVNAARMDIDIKDILAGEDETITIKLPYNATGNITFKVDNAVISKRLSNGLAIVNISALTLGEHKLTVFYSGDNNYTDQKIEKIFSIKHSLSQIIASSSSVTYGEDVIVTSKVTSGASGSVTFVLNHETITVNLTDSQANAVFTNVPAGNYVITTRYNGDKTYKGSVCDVKINVKKAVPNIMVNTSPLLLNENIRIDALLNNDAMGNVTFHIQGQYSPRNRTVNNGVSSWLISPLSKGSYNLIVTYCGDRNYESITTSKILVLNQNETVLNVNIGDVNADDDLMVYATLNSDNKYKITGNITLEINDKYYKVVVSDGVGLRNLGEFKAGRYTYTATYTGSDLFSMSTIKGSFNVRGNSYKITGNKNIVQYYGTYKSYKVRLLNNNVPVKKAIITVKINKKNIKVKTDNKGYATLKLKLKAGKYSITASYKKVTVKNKVTVKPILITKNMVVKKGKTVTYTAKLLNKYGKKVKNKKVIFKVKGKKYIVKTNKKGIAKIKIKKLKVGKYKIQSIYGKVKNTNTIKIK
ncbi:Ig-like domain (group 3) [Methanobrevibacter gottschalkii]|uniref:Ig-like domain (Group 3) n=2 Tax=Methanobrevibacter gottschalkii TaxID=190974 RepID=A0A1H7GVY2_9EURY|nr:Ig-like domain (group 3) [Methanobrevibacter gottschalkii]